MTNTKKRAMTILSGGLDSTVSIAYLKDKYDIVLAITFDYGQRARESEISAAKKICEFYKIEHKVIELPWLKDITKTALVNTDKDLPEIELDGDTISSMKAVWVPNRNGTFINIAAAFCETYDIDYIIFGANKEEATTFPDNSPEFIEEINKSLSYSTLKKVEVIAPLSHMTKTEIVTAGAKKCVPFELIMSCYSNTGKHCGICESCKRFKHALDSAGLNDIKEKVFYA